MSLEAKYLYPPNWDGTVPEKGGPKRYVLNLTGQFEEGQTDVQVVDLSEMVTVDGQVPDRMTIDSIAWTTSGSGFRMFWDRDPEREIITCVGQNCVDWTKTGGMTDPAPEGDETGDLMISNFGEYFNVTIAFRVRKDN